MELIIVSGRSGSGKSVALHVLEDLGFYCVDNLPLSLWAPLLDKLEGSYQRVAISVDIRNFPNDGSPIGKLLKESKAEIKLTTIFLDAKDDVLMRRYSETRRLHPLSQSESAEQAASLETAIRQERKILSPLSRNADLRIDTSRLSVHDLSRLLRERICGQESQQLIMVFESFGFKNGVPNDMDFQFDVRFLPNPHWKEELRPLTGLDLPVQEYLEEQEEVGEFLDQIINLLESWLPQLEANNRAYLTVAIGCTGGQHRSVYITEKLADHFANIRRVQRRHRTLEKNETH